MELCGFNLEINRRRVQAILSAVPRYLQDLETPRLPPAELTPGNGIEVWAGLRPCTPDGLPILGRAPGFSNLTLAAGHAMWGISMASATGKLVAEVVLGDRPYVDITPLRLQRF
jgi:D-amino-acid dehydrogenase